ncbi:MAG: GAF domain-containing protein [Spirirestis rafaelensis WJT71-NPBG6]|nr:GAF domain-containing protein [Spirirestis rafaelensis WJT71-NPBG6]
MSITANSQLPNLLSKNLKSITSKSDNSVPGLGSELIYTQDATGNYLTFYWSAGDRLGINSEQIIGDLNRDEIFAPVEKVAYLQRLGRIVKNLVPERCQCWFSYRQELFELELVISPIMPTLGTATTTVLVMGRLLQTKSNKKALHLPPPPPTELELALNSHQYQKLVSQITRNIRRTLDLDTIWQQTVDSLGKALRLERCIICPYHKQSTKVSIIAEYHKPDFDSMLGLEIDLATEPAFAQALATLEPIVENKPKHLLFGQEKILVVATCHQDQPNALIAISLRDECYKLTKVELDLAKEVADQLGTAIAHATLYKELEAARQKAEEASRLKTEFLTNVSHEIRTPLNGMIGFQRLILDGMADDVEEQNQFLLEAHKLSLHLLDIIQDILDFAKIEAGKMDLELRSVNLDELLSDVGNSMHMQAEQKSLSFEMQTPETSDEIIVYGDYLRLKQVIINLVGNAIKFTHEGGITLSADVVRKKVVFQDQQFPGMVRVRVADTGIGVSLDKQDKLFQLFSQVDGSRTRQYGGTGLGLAISQKLVEAMGGEVNFYSLGEGLGSTVTFTVPLYQQPVMVLQE